MKLQAFLSPSEVLAQVAQALPTNVRGHVIIVGSLAAAYHFFAGDRERAIRTKDVAACSRHTPRPSPRRPTSPTN